VRFDLLPDQIDGHETPMKFWQVLVAVSLYSQEVPAYGTVKEMARKAKVSTNTFRKYVRLAAVLGFLRIEPRAGFGEGSETNLYVPLKSGRWMFAFRRRNASEWPVSCGNPGGSVEGAKRKVDHNKGNLTSGDLGCLKENPVMENLHFKPVHSPRVGIEFSTKAPEETQKSTPPTQPEIQKPPEPQRGLPLHPVAFVAAVRQVFRWHLTQDEARRILARCRTDLERFSIMAVLYALTRKYPLDFPDRIESPGAFINGKLQTLRPEDCEEDQRLLNLKLERDARLKAIARRDGSKADAQRVVELTWLSADPESHAGELVSQRRDIERLEEIRKDWGPFIAKGETPCG
jgi:hypothetical protein